jgi:carotene biosynthesis associated membrane protein
MTSLSTVRRRPDPALVLAGAAAGVMALTQIAIPLADERAGLTTIVVLAFAAATAALTARVWGWRRAATALVVIAVVTAVLERVGTATGWPFGHYEYGDALQPQIAGVPVVVPLAWFAMSLPAREVAARLAPTRWGRVAIGAVALTAWDVMLDPQMVAEGYWTWEADGPWRGIPLSNYAGWLISSAGLMVLLSLLLPDPGRSRPLLGLYTWWAIMQTLGFLAFFGDPLVGVVGGLAMLPLTALAWRSERRRADRSVVGAVRG